MVAGRRFLGVEYRLLGRTGLRVSPLCLGTMNFGNQAEEAEGHRIMDRALELGINFFDTANVYGAPGVPTEEIIGRWLIQGERRRERTVIATKVYGGRDAWPNTSRLSARHIRESCERSLRRMQTDYIDLYQMHHIDRDTPWDEIWQAMEVLVQQGKILYVGSSNFAGWHIVKANERAARRNFLGLVSEQSLYNLNARMVELGDHLVVKPHVDCADGPVELLDGTGTDDWCRHRRVVQEPGQRDVGGRRAVVCAQLFPRFERRPHPLDLLLHPLGAAAALSDLLQGAAENAASERAPRDHAEAVMLRCG